MSRPRLFLTTATYPLFTRKSLKRRPAPHRAVHKKHPGKGLNSRMLIMHGRSPQQFHKPLHIFNGIIYSLEQHILDRHGPAGRIAVVPNCLHQPGDRVGLVHRHDPVPHIIRRGIQRHGKAHVHPVIREFLDHRSESAGRERHLPGREPHPVPVRSDLDERSDCCIIAERFAGAHENNVRDRFFVERCVPRQRPGSRSPRR